MEWELRTLIAVRGFMWYFVIQLCVCFIHFTSITDVQCDYCCHFWHSCKGNIICSVKILLLLIRQCLKVLHLGMFTCAGPTQQKQGKTHYNNCPGQWTSSSLTKIILYFHPENVLIKMFVMFFLREHRLIGISSPLFPSEICDISVIQLLWQRCKLTFHVLCCNPSLGLLPKWGTSRLCNAYATTELL